MKRSTVVGALTAAPSCTASRSWRVTRILWKTGGALHHGDPDERRGHELLLGRISTLVVGVAERGDGLPDEWAVTSSNRPDAYMLHFSNPVLTSIAEKCHIPCAIPSGQ